MIACRTRCKTHNRTTTPWWRAAIASAMLPLPVSVAASLFMGAALTPSTAISAGAVDPTFGSSGQIPAADHFVIDVVPTSADGLLVLSCLAQHWEYSCFTSLSLRRFSRDGKLDMAFGTSGVSTLNSDGSGAMTAQRSDGALLVTGRADNGSGFVAVTTASGQPDPVFSGQSVLKLAQPVRALAVEGDGKLLVGTVPDLANSAECPGPGWTLQRLSASGVIDPTFGAAGSITSVVVEGEADRNCDLAEIWAESGSELVIQTSKGLRRLRGDGSVDTTFGMAGGLTTLQGTVTRTADGRFLNISAKADGWSVRRYDSNGREDAAFGPGGVIELDIAAVLSDFRSIDEHWVDRVVAVAEGGRYYASVHIAGRLGSTGAYQSGTFILAFLADGSVDTAFGDGGKVQMSRSAVLSNRGLFTQSDGKLIVVAGGAIYRLLTGNEPSPGAVSASLADPVPVVEGSAARIVLSRTAGSSTAISVSYQTVGQDAVAELDFVPVSGRLFWAAGDSSERIVEVPTVDDTMSEAAQEYFVFRIAPADGAPIITSAETWIAVADNDPPPPPPPQATQGGGGGALGMAEALALLSVWAAGVLRRRKTSAPARRAAASPRDSPNPG